jgi:signal transduction histidine kinase/CheY-like chemotaxis protein
MSIYILIPIVAFIVNTFVWSYVLGQRQQDPVSRNYLLLSTACGGWIIGDFLMLSPLINGYEMVVINAQAPFWIPTGFLFMNFAYALADKRHDIISLIAGIVSAVGIILFISTDWIISRYDRFDWGVGLSGTQSAPFFVYTGVNILFGCYAIWIIFSKLRSVHDPVMRTTIRYILFGGVAAVFFVVLLNVVIPDLLNIRSIPRFGSSALVIFIFIVFLAVLKHRFMATSAGKVAEELFEEIDDGIVIINRVGEIQRTNHKAKQLMACAESREQLQQILADDVSERTVRFRTCENRSGETEKTLSITVSDASYYNEPLGKIAIIRDITDQTRAEEVLRESRDALEKEVEKRVFELRHAQKMEAMGTLAGGIAHDFNNILAAISGFTHAALQALPAVHPVRNDLNEVIIASSRAREIVQQILTFSRPHDRMEHRTVSIREILDESLDLLRIALPSSIRVETQLVDPSGVMQCDPTQISQVLMNLGTNAFQAMKKRQSGVLTIRVERVLLDSAAAERYDELKVGAYSRITFEDNGTGMSKKTLTHIFDPFFTTRKQGEGAGLGLSTALEIIRNHNGAIAVSSEMGKGTCFTIHLPVLDEAEETDIAAFEEIRGGDEHIMVVDDEAQLRRVARRLLEPLGYRVTTFAKGPDALVSFQEFAADYDLVITDQTMPRMTGLQLASRLLAIRPNIPIILLSGYGAAVSEETVLKAGIKMFLKKPVPQNRLPIEIRSLLDSAHG